MHEPQPGLAALAVSAQTLASAAQLQRIEELSELRRRMVLRRIPSSALLLWAKCRMEKGEITADSRGGQTLAVAGVCPKEPAYARLDEPWNGF